MSNILENKEAHIEASDIKLKSVNELLGKNLTFFVPAYQRGYRWGKKEVTDLLNDIYDFFEGESKTIRSGEIYCLQPLVVKKISENYFELIDVQQRLTTLRLILDFLPVKRNENKQKERFFSLNYETREKTDEYLKCLKKDSEEAAKENIDFFHLFEARRVIEQYFKDHPDEEENILRKIRGGDDNNRKVKFIWYEASDEEKGEDLFTRLNIGKIPLNDAELIRALFLKKKKGEDDTQADRNTLSQLHIAQEWDEIERRFQSDDFWYFLGGDGKEVTSRILLLLTLLSLRNQSFLHEDMEPTGEFSLYQKYFSENKDQGLESGTVGEILWKEVKKVFLILQSWYEDRELFHLVGYLMTISAENNEYNSLKKIIDLWDEIDTKDNFKKKLLQGIKQKFLENNQSLKEFLHSLSYGEDNNKIKDILLLFNLATLLSDSENNARFQFDRYQKQKWDIEHICPQVDEMSSLNRKDKKNWLEETIKFLRTYLSDSELIKTIEEIQNNESENEDFDKIFKKSLNLFKVEEEKGDLDFNGISNLTLLKSSHNRSYKNAIFPVKRQKIIEWDQVDDFIPLCTKNVFLKYYSSFPESQFYWGREDMKNYQKEMIKILERFFKEKNNA